MEDWEGALATYRRSLEADYNQPDLWDLEKTYGSEDQTAIPRLNGLTWKEAL